MEKPQNKKPPLFVYLHTILNVSFINGLCLQVLRARGVQYVLSMMCKCIMVKIGGEPQKNENERK